MLRTHHDKIQACEVLRQMADSRQSQVFAPKKAKRMVYVQCNHVLTPVQVA